MSDLQAALTRIEHHSLECLTFQWRREDDDDSVTDALALTDAELAARGAIISTLRRHGRTGTSGRVETLTIGIRREVDRLSWEIDLNRGDWLVAWLHHERVHAVWSMSARDGETLFHPTAPVIPIRPGLL